MFKEWKTNGLFPDRIPDIGLYDLGYFKGEKTDKGIQYPSDGSYLNPESNYQNKFKDMLHWMGSFLPKGRLLDVGCGPGHLSYWSNKLGLPYFFVNSDVSYPVLEFSKDQNKGLNVVNNLANFLPFKPNSFDGVIFSDMLLHLWPKDAFNTVKQASALIKDNGFVFIKIGNRHSLTSSVRKEEDHVWLPTVNELKKMLRVTGFKPETISYFTRGFPLSNQYRNVTGQDLRLPVGGSSIFMAAQK